MIRPVLIMSMMLHGAACSGTGDLIDYTDETADSGNDDGVGDPGADTAPGSQGWQALMQIPTGALQAHAAVALDDSIYLIGGFDQDASLSDAVHVYDVTTGMWSMAAPLPRAMSYPNAAVVDGRIYVLGGLIDYLLRESGETWVYDPATDAWSSRAPLAPGAARGAAAVAAIDGRIYLAGGLGARVPVSHVSAYDPDTDTWQYDLAAMPAPRAYAASATMDGQIYVAGGREGTTDVSELLTYDPQTNAWTARAPMSRRRASAAAAVLGARIVVVGGTGTSGTTTDMIAQVEAYDPATDAWTLLPPIPVARHSMSVTSVRNALYVPGGGTKYGFSAVSMFDVFFP